MADDKTAGEPDDQARRFPLQQTPLLEHASGGLGKPSRCVADRARGVRGKHQAFAYQSIHRRCDGSGIARGVPVTLLERESRITVCKSLRFGHGKWDVAAGQVACIALAEPAALTFHPV